MRYFLIAALLVFFLTGCLAAEPFAISQQPTATSHSRIPTIPRPTTTPSFQENSDVPDVDDETTDSLTKNYETNNYPANETQAKETAVIEIPMQGEIAQRSAELSGLAWYGDWLILLPQYPDYSDNKEEGRLFALAKADILAFLDGELEGPLKPREVAVDASALWTTIRGYEGFEAIAFTGDQAFLTIESSPSWGMIGYLVKAKMSPDLSQLVIDTSLFVPLPSPTGLHNKADEALLIAGEEVLSFHEANGHQVNESPAARRFDQDMQLLGTIPFPSIEYRITDVTDLDENGRFWAINYYFPGELSLRPGSDPIAETYGEGPTHAGADAVARLLEFELTETGIKLVDRPPIQLELHPLELRNWEGIVRLENRGFLLVTDKFPETILGFVPKN